MKNIYEFFQISVGIAESDIFDFAGIPCAQLSSGSHLQGNPVVEIPVRIIAISSEITEDLQAPSVRYRGNEIVHGPVDQSEKSHAEFKRSPTALPSLIYQGRSLFILPIATSFNSYITGYYPKVRPVSFDSRGVHSLCALHQVSLPDLSCSPKRSSKPEVVLTEEKTGRWKVLMGGKPVTKFVDPNLAVKGQRFRRLASEQGWHYVSEKGFWANASLADIRALQRSGAELDTELEIVRNHISELRRKERQLEIARSSTL